MGKGRDRQREEVCNVRRRCGFGCVSCVYFYECNPEKIPKKKLQDAERRRLYEQDRETKRKLARAKKTLLKGGLK